MPQGRDLIVRQVAGVGSRETPEEIKPLFLDIFECLTDDNYQLTSGDAQGPDEWAHEGAMRSSNYGLIGANIFLPWNGVRRHDGTYRYEDGKVFFDASKFENWERAGEISLAARGSWEGLGRGGIALHTRNAYQVLSRSLEKPVKQIVCWALPVGKKGRVRGGTNTAHQIGLDYNVPIINLATEEGMQRAMDYLRRKGRR
jgi:hypothetical protein